MLWETPRVIRTGCSPCKHPSQRKRIRAVMIYIALCVFRLNITSLRVEEIDF